MPHSLPPPTEVNFTEIEIEDEQTKHANFGTASTSTLAEDAAEVPLGVTEAVQAVAVTQIKSKMTDDVAATKIQTAFRGYLV